MCPPTADEAARASPLAGILMDATARRAKETGVNEDRLTGGMRTCSECAHAFFQHRPQCACGCTHVRGALLGSGATGEDMMRALFPDGPPEPRDDERVKPT